MWNRKSKIKTRSRMVEALWCKTPWLFPELEATCDSGSSGVEREHIGYLPLYLTLQHQASLPAALTLIFFSVITKCSYLGISMVDFVLLLLVYTCQDEVLRPSKHVCVKAAKCISLFSLFPVNTVIIGKHGQRAKTLDRITGTWEKRIN